MSRRKGRYVRRFVKRNANKENRARAIGDLPDIFTFHKMFKYGVECCNGVRWKSSTQRFELHLFSGSAARRKAVLEGKYKWRKCTRFTLCERGKKRVIDAPHIHDRQVQKVLTKEVLVPLYTSLLIHNNGASLKGKGLKFAQSQLKNDLRRHYRKYGLAGHVIITDCKGYFPNADHSVIRNNHRKIRCAGRIRAMLDSILDILNWPKGVPLGIEPSQMEMVYYPTMLDTYMKCQLRLDGAGHYMDDYYMLVPPHINPRTVFLLFRYKAKDNKLVLSENKTHIIPFGYPFRFCKAKYTVLITGRIVVHGCRETAKRMRHKMKSFIIKIKTGIMSYADLWASVQGVWNYYAKTDDHGRLLSLRRRFYAMYGFSGEKYENFKVQHIATGGVAA